MTTASTEFELTTLCIMLGSGLTYIPFEGR